MKIPTIAGIIERRILVNYRVDPIALARQLPAPFRPQLVGGMGVAGICLIRLRALHLRFLPALPGWSSENAAHRFAVEWDENGQVRRGVYIPRRDTNSRLSVLVGGRLFPGIHHHALFDVHDDGDRIELSVNSDDAQVRLRVKAHSIEHLPADSVFTSLREASDFFEAGALGYSATHQAGRYDGLRLRTTNWQVKPLEIESVTSSYFDDPAHFASGEAQLDSILLMRDVQHDWCSEPAMCAPPAAI